jgi:MFS transporter, DHA2 family, multidrug resistance protein
MAGEVLNGVPRAAADGARDTLGGALEVAAELPTRVGAAVTDAAQTAFIEGLHLAAVISALGALALALLVVTMLRSLKAGGGQGSADQELENLCPQAEVLHVACTES